MLKQQIIQLDFVVKRDHVSDVFTCFSLMVSELIEIVYCKYNSLCKYESAENSSIVIMLWGISGQMQPWINVPHEHLTASGCTVQLQLVGRPMCGSSQYIRL